MALSKVWDLFGKRLDEFGTLGPRADDRHFAAQHVEQSRQFIQTQFSQT
jgi:hypothetical protein